MKLFPHISLSRRQSSKQVTSLRILQLAPHTLVKRARNYQVKISYHLSVAIAICQL